ncbi:MAG: LysR family transcriptional regulator [Betaproteobacteria bacterium]|nr:LysR family transcriptional regulator [Betaproteobacteria bacterium]
MDRFHAIAAFVKVVETGSFARAAERLDLSVSSVSRQVADLEAHLDARLLNRTTRRLSLTEAGRAFHERCVQLLADLEEAESVAGAGTAVPRGTLRVSAGVTFGTAHLAPAAAAFMARHADMRLDVELSDRIVDLVDEGFDAAVRIGAVGGQNLVGRRVGASELVCCAAPAYVARHGAPRAPEDLVRHACLLYEYAPQRDLWTFGDRKGGQRRVRVTGPVHANSGAFLAALAAEGVGIAYEPDFIVGADVAAGRLVPLLRDFPPAATPIHVVYPSRRHLSAKVRAFAEFLQERFARPAWALELAATPARRGVKTS